MARRRAILSPLTVASNTLMADRIPHKVKVRLQTTTARHLVHRHIIMVPMVVLHSKATTVDLEDLADRNRACTTVLQDLDTHRKAALLDKAKAAVPETRLWPPVSAP